MEGDHGIKKGFIYGFIVFSCACKHGLVAHLNTTTTYHSSNTSNIRVVVGIDNNIILSHYSVMRLRIKVIHSELMLFPGKYKSTHLSNSFPIYPTNFILEIRKQIFYPYFAQRRQMEVHSEKDIMI